MNQTIYLNKVLNMVENSLNKKAQFFCDICEKEFEIKDLSEVEMTKGVDKLVCKKCEINLPEPDLMDEDHGRGER